MKDNYQIDKALMAFKSQRFIECLDSYEAALTKEYSIDAWLGLSLVKLHLLSENQTIKDVQYCLNKTIELYPKSKKQVLNELMKNVKYLVYKYIDIIAQLEAEITEAQQKKAIALLASAAGAVMGASSSTSKWSNRFKLATGAGLGYSLKKWADEEKMEVVQKGVYDLIKDTCMVVSNFAQDNGFKDEKEFSDYLDEINASVENIQMSTSEEDL